MARRGVSIGALSRPDGSSQVRCAPVTLVPGREISVIAATCAAGVAEHENALLVVHEGLRLGEVGGAGAVLDAEPVALAHDPARAAGHFRDYFRAERSRRSTASRHCTGWPSR